MAVESTAQERGRSDGDEGAEEDLRYRPLAKIASGGMATVFVGILRGALGFTQLVAIKRPHGHLMEDPNFRRELLVEARLASLVRHANVVDVRDVEEVGDSVQLIMDYVEGASLAQLIGPLAQLDTRRRTAIVLRIALDACAGLQAIHDALDDNGESLGLVHRDVSPQNILVGLDGVSRVTDFGLAKSAGAPTSTASLRGKIGYMAPELVRGRDYDRKVDIFAMGVVLWEAFAAKRLFMGANEAHTIDRVLKEAAPPMADIAPEAEIFDDAIARATDKTASERFDSMATFATTIGDLARAKGLLATHAEVGRFVRESFGESLTERHEGVRTKLADLDAGIEVAPLPANDPPADAKSDSQRLRQENTVRRPKSEMKEPSSIVPRVLIASALVGVLAAGAFMLIRKEQRDPGVQPAPPQVLQAPALASATTLIEPVATAPVETTREADKTGAPVEASPAKSAGHRARVKRAPLPTTGPHEPPPNPYTRQ